MCYACRPTCENCKPKYLHCAECGYQNILKATHCVKCRRPIEQRERDEALLKWKEAHNKD